MILLLHLKYQLHLQLHLLLSYLLQYIFLLVDKFLDWFYLSLHPLLMLAVRFSLPVERFILLQMLLLFKYLIYHRKFFLLFFLLVVFNVIHLIYLFLQLAHIFLENFVLFALLVYRFILFNQKLIIFLRYLMQFWIFNLKLIDNFFLVKKFCLHKLYFVQIVLNQRSILLSIKFIHLELVLRMVDLELLNHWHINVFFTLKLVVLYFELVLSLLFIFQVKEKLLVFSLHQVHLKRYLFNLLLISGDWFHQNCLEIDSFPLEQISQPHIFLLKFFDSLPQLVQQSRMRISIDNRLVFNVHGFTCIFECVQTLFVIWLGWAYACDHVCVWISTQTVLKNSGQFWISECYELSLFFLNCQSWYHISQLQQPKINVNSLL